MVSIFILFMMMQLLIPRQVFSKEDLITKEERAFLDDFGQIEMMMDEKFPPISYYDNETEEYQGIAVEVIEQLAVLLDFDYQIIKDDRLSWSDKLEKIKNNELDLLAGASVKEDRMEYGYFNKKAYFETNYAIIGSIENHINIRELSDIANYKVGLIRETGINELIRENISSETPIKYFYTMEEGLVSLKNQEIDLLTDNEAVFIDEYFKDNRFDFEIIYSIDEPVKSYAFLSPKTEEGLMLTQILDKGMKELDLDQIVANHYENKSIFKYYKEYTEELRQENVIKNIILGSLAFIVLVILVLIAIINLRSKELRLASRTDYLTNLKNRNALFDDYEKRSKLKGKQVYFIDLDDFKSVNDNYGHDAGDEVLRASSERLMQLAPDSDIYRMGGDEFLIITDRKQADLGGKILKSIQEPVIYRGEECKVYASVGYLGADDFGESSLNEIINLADHAMLEAKSNGKNNILKVNERIISNNSDGKRR